MEATKEGIQLLWNYEDDEAERILVNFDGTRVRRYLGDNLVPPFSFNTSENNTVRIEMEDIKGVVCCTIEMTAKAKVSLQDPKGLAINFFNRRVAVEPGCEATIAFPGCGQLVVLVE